MNKLRSIPLLNLDFIMPTLDEIKLGDANVKRVYQNAHHGTEQSFQKLLYSVILTISLIYLRNKVSI